MLSRGWKVLALGLILATTWFDSETGAAQDAAAQIAAKNKAVSVTGTLKITERDDLHDILYPRIEMQFRVANHSAASIAGVKVSFVVVDAFGEQLVAGDTKLAIRLGAGQSRTPDVLLAWEDRPYNNSVFAKLYGPVVERTAHVTAVVTDIAGFHP